jgi:hypothetical protein
MKFAVCLCLLCLLIDVVINDMLLLMIDVLKLFLSMNVLSLYVDEIVIMLFTIDDILILSAINLKLLQLLNAVVIVLS